MPLPYSSVTGKENAESPKFGSKYSSLPVEETSPGYSSRPSEKPKDGQGQGADYSAKYSQQQRYKHADVKGSKYWELGKLGPDLERKEIVQKVSSTKLRIHGKGRKCSCCLLLHRPLHAMSTSFLTNVSLFFVPL